MKEYPNIRNYLRELYQIPEIQSTVHMDHIKNHYYGSIKHLNAFRFKANLVLIPVIRLRLTFFLFVFLLNYSIVPAGPGVLGDMAVAHDRNRFE